MAIGDARDVAARMHESAPASWFPRSAPVLGALRNGMAATWTFLHERLVFIRHQARLSTASGVYLDVAVEDFLGGRIRRREGEGDASFRLRVRREIFRPKATRAALSQAIEELTGFEPVIFEPARPADTGSWNAGGAAYNAAGGYGSHLTPYQCFVKATRPVGIGVPFSSGFDENGGGLGVGRLEFLGPEKASQGVSDDDIREAILSTIALGTVVWLVVQDPPREGVRWDVDGYWDISRWG